MNFPILSAIIFIPFISAFFILITQGSQKNIEKNSKYIAIFASSVNFFLSILLWFSFDQSISTFQFVEKKNWIDGFINFKLVTPLSFIPQGIILLYFFKLLETFNEKP